MLFFYIFLKYNQYNTPILQKTEFQTDNNTDENYFKETNLEISSVQISKTNRQYLFYYATATITDSIFEENYGLGSKAEGNGGGGGGWYGGKSITSTAGYSKTPGAGGSGYVNSTFFYAGKTIAGNNNFYSPYGSLEFGHSGDGVAKITWLDIFSIRMNCDNKRMQYMLFIIITNY